MTPLTRVAKTRTRLHFDRQDVEWLLLNPQHQLIMPIVPSASSTLRGYSAGRVRLTARDFISTFDHIRSTAAWEKVRCYHFPRPPKRMLPFFTDEG